ncbi:hypothetical protein ACOV11_07340 [Vibrio natriegens]
MDVFQVVDSAVKIGLGALIAGVFSQMSATRQFKRDMLKKSKEDSQALIKELALSLENSSIATTKLASMLRQKIYHGLLVDEISITMYHEVIVESQSHINLAMANAVLLDLNEVHKLLRRYSKTINLMINVIDEGIFDNSCLTKLQTISNDQESIKLDLNKLISLAYKSFQK